MKSDISSIESFFDAIKNLAAMDGKEIRDATFPQIVTISKTEEEAKSRAEYEQYLKTGESNVGAETVASHCQNFIKDMLDKGSK